MAESARPIHNAPPIVAEVAPKAAGGANQYKTLSGFEGREGELGLSMSILLKMLGNHTGYAHEMNDPLVKAHLLAILAQDSQESQPAYATGTG